MSTTLREMFFSKVRDKFYAYLKTGPMREWRVETIYGFIDEIVYSKRNISQINAYLANHIVTIENMNDHVDVVVASILIPSLKNMRVSSE